MNEWDIKNALRRFNTGETPNLAAGARTLSALANWTNRNSDGWAYWPKPRRAAKALMTLLEAADRYEPVDVTATQLTKALSPIKAFLTRQGVSYDALGLDTVKSTMPEAAELDRLRTSPWASDRARYAAWKERER